MILIGLIAIIAFQKQSISNNLSLLKYFLKNVIKTLETLNSLSYISIVFLSLNDDLAKIR